MNAQTLVAGVGMVPFKSPGRSDPYDVMAETAVRAALADARLDYDLIDQAFAAFVLADSGSGQRTLYRVGITGIPIANVNNNCASGSTALYLARQALLSGEAECTLAVGFEEMRAGAAERSTAASDPHGHQRECAATAPGFGALQRALPPALQLPGAQLEWMRRELGVADTTFAQIAVKARAHAARNPYAMLRDPLTVEAVLAQPPLTGHLRKLYACLPSSGAAAVVLCTARFAARHGVKQDVAMLAQAMVSDTAPDLEEGNVLDALGRGATHRASRRAYATAGVGPEDIDVAEVHDCVVSNELIACSSLGFCGEDDIDRFVQEGENTYGGKVVIGPSGGLLSMGHPLGATGVAQIAELTWQLRGQAGGRQVEGARTALAHNGGLGRALSVAILQAR